MNPHLFRPPLLLLSLPCHPPESTQMCPSVHGMDLCWSSKVLPVSLPSLIPSSPTPRTAHSLSSMGPLLHSLSAFSGITHLPYRNIHLSGETFSALPPFVLVHISPSSPLLMEMASSQTLLSGFKQQRVACSVEFLQRISLRSSSLLSITSQSLSLIHLRTMRMLSSS